MKAYYKGLIRLSLILIAYKLKFIPNHYAKERLLSYFFKGWDSQSFQNIADKYSLNQINKIIRPAAMKKILWHQNQNHQVVIVTASMEFWLKKWCEKHNIELIGTCLQVENNKITGKFSSKNCFGIEKVNRINKKYNLSTYSTIYAYGDSAGDNEMLNIANKRYYKKFN